MLLSQGFSIFLELHCAVFVSFVIQLFHKEDTKVAKITMQRKLNFTALSFI